MWWIRRVNVGGENPPRDFPAEPALDAIESTIVDGASRFASVNTLHRFGSSAASPAQAASGSEQRIATG
jgi:hypothetical protein